ncbi:hypothetical protein KAFR_0H02830 [Kazachstania africana CBS 2517]|uniref:Uncharacterized protein n=1 Tax=Kazachstania africana (strain ATCC 22294 / BCRC 22015 / CBS 2517 / CECT 1963 / NBRC 1671 / NRRL Y-8276) TaxID=1071382 RepID=H2AZD6_KAZAF|nr:hypothetical protein KAFR_0H02830 [Kazachstania africana CBS 2517]CCF59692.1 hypothetical protein KAFR_0H02830 [Kazachstania africana CBS 2517]
MASDSSQSHVLKCQNCHLPLQIDSSLENLSPSQQNLLLNTRGDYVIRGHKTVHYDIPPIKNVEDIRLKDQNAKIVDSYVYLDKEEAQMENDEDTTKTLSTQINTLTNMFNILSLKSTIDYPICQDCYKVIISKLKNDYDNAVKERDTYTGFLNKLEREESNKRTDHRDNGKDGSEKLHVEKEKLLQQLIELEKEDEMLDNEILSLQKELQIRKVQENERLSHENLKQLQKLEFDKEIQILQSQYNFALNNLDILRKTNIYNETFKISHDGAFGTINKLRLGSYSDYPVSWKEINAAIGQVILLLATITTRCKCKLTGYRLQPMGSFSKILKFDDNLQDWSIFEAYNDDNFKVSKLFRKETSFDKALECILDIIQQVALSVTKPTNDPDNQSNHNSTSVFDSNLDNTDNQALPYVMFRGKINGLPVKLFSGEPNLQWTTAMKFLLTNVKWLLAFSSSKLTTAQVHNDGGNTT